MAIKLPSRYWPQVWLPSLWSRPRAGWGPGWASAAESRRPRFEAWNLWNGFRASSARSSSWRRQKMFWHKFNDSWWQLPPDFSGYERNDQLFKNLNDFFRLNFSVTGSLIATEKSSPFKLPLAFLRQRGVIKKWRRRWKTKWSSQRKKMEPLGNKLLFPPCCSFWLSLWKTVL